MLVSVIIPTYKSRGGLKKSVDSALNQTYKNIEVIVVDDNNPDTDARKETELIMDAYLSNNRVKYIRHDKNKNGAAARNTGIKNSKGDFIAFLDDDDYFYPQKLEHQVEFLQKHKEFDAVYGIVSMDNKPIVTIPYEGNAVIPLLCERTRMFTSALMFRNSAIKDIGGFDESFRRHQDFELMIKYFVHGHKVGFLPEVVIEYSKAGGNRVKGKDLENLKEQYLQKFENTIELLDQQKPGTKRKIIVNNYTSIFISHIASHEYKRAFLLWRKYFFMSPLDFMSFICFFIKNHLKR